MIFSALPCRQVRQQPRQAAGAKLKQSAFRAPNIPYRQTAIPGFDFAPTTIDGAGARRPVLKRIVHRHRCRHPHPASCRDAAELGRRVIGSNSDKLAKVLGRRGGRFAKIIKTVNIKAG